ncbi:MAG TPA: GFA family protein, partial [Polyangiaceae bacterium]
MTMTQQTSSSEKPFVPTHRGGCHCGAVRFEVALAPGFQGSRCNCSICAKTAVTGAIVTPDAFRLVAGETECGNYVWGGKVSTRFFCKTCGVHCYGAGHLAEIGGDFVSVNLNCLDDFDVNELSLVHWDGRHDNWMA